MKLIQSVSTKNHNVTIFQTIHAIKKAGFDGVFIAWRRNSDAISNQQQVELCEKLQLEIQFAHLSYDGINNIWFEGEQGEQLVSLYIQDLRECKKYNINMVVMHLTSKYEVQQPNMLGVKRIQKIVDYAESLGIKVAFENTRQFGYLEYVFQHIKNKNAGICFDVGHYHCHYNDKFNWHLFKDKILCVHFHDNDAQTDKHWLPFDGTVNFKEVIKNLKQTNYNNAITLENNYRNKYAEEMTVEEYYQESYKRAKRIEQMLTKAH